MIVKVIESPLYALAEPLAHALSWHKVWVRGYSIGHYISGYYNNLEECARRCNESLDNVYPIGMWIDNREFLQAYVDEWWCSGFYQENASYLLDITKTDGCFVCLHSSKEFWVCEITFDEAHFGYARNQMLAIGRAFLLYKGIETFYWEKE